MFVVDLLEAVEIAEQHAEGAAGGMTCQVVEVLLEGTTIGKTRHAVGAGSLVELMTRGVGAQRDLDQTDDAFDPSEHIQSRRTDGSSPENQHCGQIRPVAPRRWVHTVECMVAPDRHDPAGDDAHLGRHGAQTIIDRLE